MFNLKKTETSSNKFNLIISIIIIFSPSTKVGIISSTGAGKVQFCKKSSDYLKLKTNPKL